MPDCRTGVRRVKGLDLLTIPQRKKVLGPEKMGKDTERDSKCVNLKAEIRVMHV